MSEHIDGRSARDAMAIVVADIQRWHELGELWSDLWPHEQQELIETAKLMASKNDRDAVPEPQSLRVAP